MIPLVLGCLTLGAVLFAPAVASVIREQRIRARCRMRLAPPPWAPPSPSRPPVRLTDRLPRELPPTIKYVAH